MRYLTKSRFKLALECPSKLFYTGKKQYYNNKVENDFLAALAEGGYQVGELAKLYYPGGIAINELDYDTALKKTNMDLERENTTIYEAAFLFENLFIRADIIVKEGNVLKLIEVKAKSFNNEKDKFITKNGAISNDWKPYLSDVAFQKYVIEKSRPDLKVSAHLLLANKTQAASIDGLNQLFYISKEDGRYLVKPSRGADFNNLGNRVLIEKNVDAETDLIINGSNPGFEETIRLYSRSYEFDQQIEPPIGAQCGLCEFNPGEKEMAKGFSSGFRECWRKAGLTDEQLNQPLILSVWDLRNKDAYIKDKKYFIADLTRADLESKSNKKTEPVPWLTHVDRQELQINKSKQNDLSPFINIDGLKAEMDKWIYPLHFIDFETTAVAIPFHTGRKPYEQIAFQFSHHIVHEDGTIEHKGQWISERRGVFPNFDFVRALKNELDTDNGTIFRFAAHENTILNVVYRQLKESNESDRELLCDWIKTITRSSGSSLEQWEGYRNMIDLRDLVLKYYYNPLTGGSNSIKKVLPAILESSDFLKYKYSLPVYGSETKSLNFKDQIWIRYEDGKLINPYSLLPSIHPEASNESLDEFIMDEESGIADGGAAMIAFARMQFTEMSDAERKHIKEALLRYCELDTLAMVMIYEAWKEWCNAPL